MSDQRNRAGVFSPTVAGERLYVWIVAGTTLLLLCLLMWPLSVKRFHSTARFGLRYDSSSNLNKRELTQLVLGTIREETNHNSIASLLDEVSSQSEIQSELLDRANADEIQQALKIQSRPGKAGGAIEFRCSLIGSGTPDELNFVNTVVTRVTSRLSTQTVDHSAQIAIDQLTEQFGQLHLRVLRENQSQIQGAIDQLNSAAESIAMIDRDLSDIVFAGQEAQDGNINPRWVELDSQVSQIENSIRRMTEQENIPKFHSDVTSLQVRLERLRAQLSSTPKHTVQNAGGPRDASHISNQFASNVKETPLETSLSSIRHNVASLDLSLPRNTLNEVYRQIQNDERSFPTISVRTGELAKASIADANAMRIDSIDLGDRSHPIGGSPSGKGFLVILVVSAMFGSVAAWQFDPTTRKKRFRTNAHLEAHLGLPIVGRLEMAGGTTRSLKVPQRAVLIIVRACEWVLLALLVIFAIAALVNSEVIKLLLDNPFEAVTKIVWLITPRG